MLAREDYIPRGHRHQQHELYCYSTVTAAHMFESGRFAIQSMKYNSAHALLQAQQQASRVWAMVQTGNARCFDFC